MTAPLPQQSDLEQIIGADNVRQWSDVDNDGDRVKQANRIVWAVNQGYDYIAGRLAYRFNIGTLVAFPHIIFQLIAQRACIELYQSPRGLVDGDPANAGLNSISVQIESKLDQIIAGILQVIDAPVQPMSTPDVENCGALRWQDYHRQTQWSGEPIVIPYGRYY